MNLTGHPWVLLGLAALLGLFVGNFLNRCIFCLPRSRTNLFRLGRCPACLRSKAWSEYIPILGSILHRSRCTACENRFSWRMPAVELLAAALFLVSAWKPVLEQNTNLTEIQRGLLFVMYAWVSCVMIICTFVDLETGLLPDQMTLTGILIAAACSTMVPFPTAGRLLPDRSPWISGPLTSLSGALVGAAIPWVLRVWGNRSLKRETMGLGAVKYQAMLGSVLGPQDAAVALVFACLLGTLLALFKKATVGRAGYAEFGPLQSLGALPLLFWADRVHAFIGQCFGVVRHLS